MAVFLASTLFEADNKVLPMNMERAILALWNNRHFDDLHAIARHG